MKKQPAGKEAAKKPPGRHQPDLPQLLRMAVEADGRAHAAICREAGIHVKTFSAFMHGRRGLSAETTERLAKSLGMEIHIELKPAKASRPRKSV